MFTKTFPRAARQRTTALQQLASHPTLTWQRGLTLIEVMIVTAMLVVFVSMGIPSFSDSLKNKALSKQAAALETALSLAKSEAVTTGLGATVCPSGDGLSCAINNDWAQGWIILAPNPLDATATPRVIHHQPAIDQSIHISASGLTHTNQITFNALGGMTDPQAPGIFLFCDARGAEKARAFLVTAIGLIRAADDANQNGIPEDDQGADLTCPVA